MPATNLCGLLEEARDRFTRGIQIRDWFMAHGFDVEAATARQLAAADLADEVIHLGHCGLFPQALLLARLQEAHLPEELWEDTVDLQVCPLWQDFAAICELVDRVDHFLAVLEQNATGGHLARDARGNFDLLLVLADWCEENGRPAIAAEARHLYTLVRMAF